MKKIFYGWYIVAASIAINFYITVVFGLGFNVFFLPIVHEFGWTRAVTSGAFSLRAVESGLLAPVVGFLVDRLGPKIIILCGVIFAGAGIVMLGYINSLSAFYIAFLVAALGTTGAGHGVSWVVAVANWFERLRGRALGIAMLGPVLGGPFVVLVAVLEDIIGWRTATVLLGVGLWIVGIPLALVARSRPEAYGYLPDGDTPMAVSQAEGEKLTIERKVNGLTVSQAMQTRVFWILVSLFTLMFVGISGLLVHLIPMLEDLEYSSTQAASLLGLMFLLSGIGRIGTGILADMVDYRLVLLGLIGCQLVGLLLLISIGPSQVWLVVLFALIFGIGFGGTIPLRPFLIREFFGSRSFGALQGLVQVGAIGAGVVGPVYYGWIFDVTGSYGLAIIATIITVLMTIPFTYILKGSQ